MINKRMSNNDFRKQIKRSITKFSKENEDHHDLFYNEWKDRFLKWMNKEEFLANMNLCKETVSKWPKWKRGLLGEMSKSTCDKPRKPTFKPEDDLY